MISDFTWSISKSKLMHSCPRSFYFSLNTHRSVGPTLYNLYALGGIAIHASIQKELDKWSNGMPISPKEAIHNALEFTRRTWENRHTQIIEVINGLEPPLSLFDSIRSSLRVKLERFYYQIWPQFSSFVHVEHEKLETFHFDGLNIFAKIDLACRNPQGGLHILEWKTGGKTNEADGRIQLAVYALWARTKFKEDLSNITPAVVGLDSGRITKYVVTKEDISYVKGIINSDCTKKESYESKGDFPSSPDPLNCRSCIFLSECEDGLGIVNKK